MLAFEEDEEPLLHGDEATRAFVMHIAAEKKVPFAIIGDAIRAGLTRLEIGEAGHKRLSDFGRTLWRYSKPGEPTVAVPTRHEPVRMYRELRPGCAPAGA